MRLTRRHLREMILETVDDSMSGLGESEYYEKFTNELDNEIEINIEPVDGDHPGSVKITVAGPTSVSESTITRMEAEKLHDLLARYLQEGP